MYVSVCVPERAQAPTPEHASSSVCVCVCVSARQPIEKSGEQRRKESYIGKVSETDFKLQLRKPGTAPESSDILLFIFLNFSIVIAVVVFT